MYYALYKMDETWNEWDVHVAFSHHVCLGQQTVVKMANPVCIVNFNNNILLNSVYSMCYI